MKHIQTFESFINEQESISKAEILNEEDTNAILALYLALSWATFPAVAILSKAGVFDDGFRGPIEVFRDWKRDRIVSKIVERLNKDPEVIAFLNMPAAQQRGKWKELIAKKLDSKELKYINSVSRDRVEAGEIYRK